MKKTPQQIKNLKDALVWWKTVPKKNVAPRLGNWRVAQPEKNDPPEVSCNTIACFGGWACLWPGLQAQGLVPEEEGGAPHLIDLKTGREIGGCWNSSRILFGESALFDMCCEREYGNEHAVVTARIKAALANPEQT